MDSGNSHHIAQLRFEYYSAMHAKPTGLQKNTFIRQFRGTACNAEGGKPSSSGVALELVETMPQRALTWAPDHNC